MDSHGLDPGTKSQADKRPEMMDSDLETESPADEIDPASYRDLTKEEVLEGIAIGYKAALAGDHVSAEEMFAELAEFDE